MSEERTLVADLLAVPEEIEFAGKTYRLAPMDHLSVSGALERWAIRQAYEECNKLRPDLSDPGQANDIDGLVLHQTETRATRELVNSGHYRYGERGFDQAVNTGRGLREAVYHSLKVHHQDVTRSLVEEMAADDAKWAEVITRMNLVNDPKRKAGARKAAG